MNSTLGATLNQPVVRRIVASSAFSNMATGMFLGVLPLAVAAEGGGPFLVGAVAAAMSVWWLLSIPLSWMVDRFGPGPLLRLVLPLRTAGVAVIGANAFFDGRTALVLIFAGAAFFGLTDVLIDSASVSLPALLLDEQHYDNAYSLLHTASRVTNLVIGPAAGAALLMVNTGLPFAVVAALQLVAYLIYVPLFGDPRAAARTEAGAEGGWREVAGGVRHILADRFLKAIVLTLAGVVIAEEIVATVVPPYFRDGQQSETWAQVLGGIRSAAGVAAIVAALTAGLLARRFGRARALCVAAGGAAISPVLLAIDPAVGWVLTAMVITAVAEAVWIPLVQGEVSRRTPPHLMARTRAALMFITWGTMPVTGLLGGGVAQSLGIRPTLGIAAALALLACAAGVWRLLGWRYRDEAS